MRVEERRLGELEREICELAAHIAAATCRFLLLVAEFDERGGWAQWGAKSCAQFLSWRCSLGVVTAREQVRVARRLRELPLVREAFGTGELSYCKVRAIARVATPETEGQLVELARHATGAQLEKVVRSFGRAVAAASSEEIYAKRGLDCRWEEDGSMTLQARLTPDEGALVLEALKAAEASERDSAESPAADAAPGSDSAESPTPFDHVGARRADALVSMARSALADGGTSCADGEPCEVVVHVDVESLVGEEAQDRCEIDEGPVIAPETARRLACDGSVVRIIDRDGRPLSVGRRKRTVSAPLRRALRSRDEGCRFPGCAHKRFLHAHHLHHWARGGETTLDNPIQLCSHHHRLVHEGGFGVERAGKRGVRFRRPDGRVIADAPARQRACGPGLERQHRNSGLVIDDHTCRPRSLGDSLDYALATQGLCDRALAGADERDPSRYQGADLEKRAAGAVS